MKKLFVQIIKFGIVGGICALIDIGVTMLFSWVIRESGIGLSLTEFLNNSFDFKIQVIQLAADIGTFFGFVISVIVNYLLSMKFVFKRNENLKRWLEITIFIILSAVGCLINVLIMDNGIRIIAAQFSSLAVENPGLSTLIVKVIANVIVMIYNFISRKLFLEGGLGKKKTNNDNFSESVEK